MAIGTVTRTLGLGDIPLANVFLDLVTLVGPTNYVTGGVTGLQTALRALTNDTREIVGWIDQSIGDYVGVYDYANAKLMAFKRADGGTPGDEAAEIDLAAVTFTGIIASR